MGGVLKRYDPQSDEWRPVGLPTDSLIADELDDLVDVEAPAPNAGDVLSYDGTNWTSTQLSVPTEDIDERAIVFAIALGG